MNESHRLTKSEQQRFYREAVEQTLIRLYNKPEAESKAIVSVWWERISQMQEFQSGLLFHAEPLHTAADIANLNSIAITSQNEETYRNVLLHTRNRVCQTSDQTPLQSLDLKKPLRLHETKKKAAKGQFQPMPHKPKASTQVEEKLMAKR